VSPRSSKLKRADVLPLDEGERRSTNSFGVVAKAAATLGSVRLRGTHGIVQPTHA
jgi:hypothetical protein